MPKSQPKIGKRKQKIIWAIVLIIMVLLVDISPVGGNIRFYAKWIECGVKPVQIQSMPGIAWYEESPAFQPVLRNQSWYCTPIEAERNGYSANKNYYDFPSLRAAGEQNPFVQHLLGK